MDLRREKSSTTNEFIDLSAVLYFTHRKIPTCISHLCDIELSSRREWYKCIEQSEGLAHGDSWFSISHHDYRIHHFCSFSIGILFYLRMTHVINSEESKGNKFCLIHVSQKQNGCKRQYKDLRRWFNTRITLTNKRTTSGKFTWQCSVFFFLCGICAFWLKHLNDGCRKKVHHETNDTMQNWRCRKIEKQSDANSHSCCQKPILSVGLIHKHWNRWLHSIYLNICNTFTSAES